MVTYWGRDHIVPTQSNSRYLVLINIHFKPDLTLRNVRERPRLVSPHWAHHPEALGVIMVDSNISDSEEGRVNTWNQTFTDGDAGKLLFSVPFPHVLEIAQRFTKKDSTADGTNTQCPGLTTNLSTSLWLKHAISIAIFMCSRILGEQSVPSDHAAVRVVMQKPTIRCNQDKRIPS